MEYPVVSESVIAILIGFLAPLACYVLCSSVFCFRRVPKHAYTAANPGTLRNLPCCSSRDCVRCNAYETATRVALKKLEQPIPKLNTVSLNTVRKALVEQPVFKDAFQRPAVLYLERLLGKPCWTGDILFQGVCDSLKRQFELIHSEFLDVCDTYPKGWSTNKSESGQWNVFKLVNQGTGSDNSKAMCPATMATLGAMEEVMLSNIFGNAFFSYLSSNTVIEPHCGPTNVRIRCQLALQVPNATHSSMTVCSEHIGGEASGGQTLTWSEGECLLFDDSFTHSVAHQGAEPRAVLIVDLWHPYLSHDERKTIDSLFLPDQSQDHNLMHE